MRIMQVIAMCTVTMLMTGCTSPFFPGGVAAGPSQYYSDGPYYSNPPYYGNGPYYGNRPYYSNRPYDGNWPHNGDGRYYAKNQRGTYYREDDRHDGHHDKEKKHHDKDKKHPHKDHDDN